MDRLERSILDSLQEQSENIKERAIKNAVALFEKDLRAMVGTIAITLTNYYSVNRIGDELVIRVQIEKEAQ